MKVALIAGGTGLIGSQLLKLLLGSARYDKVIAITRKEIPAHPKLVQVQISQPMLANLDPTIWVDDVFCCLGTTIARAHSKQKFYEIDFTYPLLLGEEALKRGARQYLIISSLGANKKSPIYYSRVKGEIEEAISKVGYATVHIMRPSLLLGVRDEKRQGEETARLFYRVFDFIIPKKYKAIESEKVANAMLQFALHEQVGNFVHESHELQNFD